jgi:phage terminase large subunit
MTNDTATLKALSTPVGFACGILGDSPYRWQADALESTARPGTTAVRSPNGGGRSSIVVADSALYHLAMYPRGKVGITTADSKQLNEQILPAIDLKAQRLPFSKPVRSPYYRLENGLGGRLIAFCTDDASRVEGLHGTPTEPLLWIVDEAKSVPEPIFQGIDRCGYRSLLLASSPGLKRGTFYDAFTKTRSKVTTFTAGLQDCPHISREKIERIIEKYGENHPFTRSCIYGEFMDQDEAENYLIGVDAVERCLRNPPPYRPGSRIAFCDFGAGKSENVIVLREGNRYTVEARWKEGNKLEATTRFIQHFRRLGLEPRQITGDASDAEMLGLLAEAGWGINRQSFGAPAYDKAVYSSWSAEAWVNGSRLIEKCEVILPTDPDLIAQLTTRRRLFNTAGKVCAEDKVIMARNGIPSPDIADALFGAMSFRDLVPAPTQLRTGESASLLEFIHAVHDQEDSPGQWAGTGAFAGGLA